MPDAKPASLEDDARRERASTYRVKHVFRTVQGEGFWVGRPAVFVRLVGCNLWSGYDADRTRDAERTGADCPRWCDTDFRPDGSDTLSADALAEWMQDVGGAIDFCVLTGGEPLLQADAPLIRTLHDAGYEVAVETNGTVALADRFRDATTGALHAPDWITCSPKLPEDQLALEQFDELKLIVPDYHPADYAAFAARATPHRINGQARRVLWLQPEDGPRLAAAQKRAVELALQHPAWRVSTQTHKVLGVD